MSEYIFTFSLVECHEGGSDFPPAKTQRPEFADETNIPAFSELAISLHLALTGGLPTIA